MKISIKPPFPTATGQWILITVSFATLITLIVITLSTTQKPPHLVTIADQDNSEQYVNVDGYIYKENKLIAGADGHSFRVLSDTDYAVDAHHVFYLGTQIINADPLTFTIVGDGSYTKDAISVFCQGTPVKGLDSTSFNQLSDDYWGDRTHIYNNDCTPLNGVDVQSFKVLAHGYALDKDRVYFAGDVVQNADVATFKLVPELAPDSPRDTIRTYDAQDKNHTYYQGDIVK